MKYAYKRWSGAIYHVTADEVRFEPSGHVSFWLDGQLVLAERTEDCNKLQPLEGASF